ncbi:MAG: ATP-binding protein [Rhodospirillales bacterium]|nr:ATP-binding protein [Rhodospirillales bacterium]
MAEREQPGSRMRDAAEWRALAGRLAALSSISGEAAHRLNNFRAVIDGTLALLSADAASPLSKQRLQRLREAAAGAEALAEAIVSIARSRPGGDLRFDLAGWLVAARSWMQPLLDEGTTLTIEVPPTPAPLVGDPDALRTALTALLLNARAAVGSAGHVGVRLERLQREGRAMLMLSVTDDGPGMAPVVAARAREPFFTTRPPAAGLGLSVAEAYVSRCGGYLDLLSDPQRGTIVSLWLGKAEGTCLP